MARAIGNDEIADVLERVADLLEVQHASPYRVRAYRRGARTVRSHPSPIAALVLAGEPLEDLPGIGRSLSGAISETVQRGRLGLLERLEGQVSPEDLFTTVPGIGEVLAARIHRELGVDTLEELELAAHDGRLETLAGLGSRRVRGLRDALAGILSRSSRRRARRIGTITGRQVPPPKVKTLLAVDALYRRRAAAGELRCIAPR
ncbi:MAG: helix-hairpin-helix domain-containing protein, partial [Myxococcales bacterium]|nr:helix-hairpin-helix domain-containing protein [Myxococcales bacterium]